MKRLILSFLSVVAICGMLTMTGCSDNKTTTTKKTTTETKTDAKEKTETKTETKKEKA